MNTASDAGTHIELLIQSPEELGKLASITSVFKRYTRVNLNLEGMDADKQKTYEEKINRFYGACGCGEGKFFVLLGFLTFIGYSYSKSSLQFTWLNAGKGFLFCLAGAAVGKLFGLYRAHLKLRKVIREMNSDYPTDPTKNQKVEVA
jgi:hypothetical protein